MGVVNSIVKTKLILSFLTFLLRKTITYANSFEDIVAFVDSSDSCRQFTKFSCYGMIIFHTDGTQYVALLDRNDTVMEYIGGGPENKKGTTSVLNISR